MCSLYTMEGAVPKPWFRQTLAISSQGWHQANPPPRGSPSSLSALLTKDAVLTDVATYRTFNAKVVALAVSLPDDCLLSGELQRWASTVAPGDS